VGSREVFPDFLFARKGGVGYGEGVGAEAAPLKLFETSRRIVRAWEVPGEVRGQHRGRYQ